MIYRSDWRSCWLPLSPGPRVTDGLCSPEGEVLQSLFKYVCIYISATSTTHIDKYNYIYDTIYLYTAYRILLNNTWKWFFDIDKLVQCAIIFQTKSFLMRKKIHEKIESGLHWKYSSCSLCSKPYKIFLHANQS